MQWPSGPSTQSMFNLKANGDETHSLVSYFEMKKNRILGRHANIYDRMELFDVIGNTLTEIR